MHGFHTLMLGGAVATLLGCGSQQLRLTSPDTSGSIGYTCNAANSCYPASLATPVEGQPDEAIPLTMPRECNGRIHEILIRNADSSDPEIDVTCAAAPAGAAAKAPPPDSAHDPVDTSAIEPLQ